jgi:hypothetical protein
VFTATLATTPNDGSVVYVEVYTSPDLDINLTTGQITTTGTLAAGVYTISGTTTDDLDDTGDWSYTLTVSAGTITQTSAISGTVSTALSSGFTEPLATSGGIGQVSYTAPASSPAGLVVSSAGVISTAGTLSANTYVISGSDTDTYEDTGTWTYSLTVSAGTITQTITQTSPVSGTTSTTLSSRFTESLTTSGGNGSVNFSGSSNPAGLVVSSAGVISATRSLTARLYTISGNDSDTYGDTGTWTFALTVSAATIAQSAPTSNSTTLTASSSFTQQLKTSGNTGAVTFATTGSGSTPAGVVVSSSGVVSTKGALSVGTYTISGTDSDAFGDKGTWTYTLKVASTAITQHAPFANTKTITPATSTSFTDKLKATGYTGSLKFVVTGSGSTPPGVFVSSAGVVSTKGALAVGTYTISGKDSDSVHDAGSWSYSLTVTATKIAQSAPSAATTTTAKAWSDRLKVSGAYGTVKYSQSAGAPDLKVSSSGAISAPDNLRAGRYKASGTVSDSYRDIRGAWRFTLTVTTSRISQASPEVGSATTGKPFSGQLKVSGSYRTVTYSQSAGAPDLKVSSSGTISAPDSLRAGSYMASGTDSDSLGDSGSWSFTLTVSAYQLTQIAPTSARTTSGSAFTGQLKFSGSHGTVSYSQSSGAPDLKVSSSGAVSAPASLPAGTYKATGIARDPSGDVGTWSFTLTLASTKITQMAPTSTRTTTGTPFTGQLKFSGSQGTVSYSQSSGAPDLKVSTSGAVSAPASLPAGTYTATGTARDSHGGTGSWSFSLTVAATRLTQAAPAGGSTTAGSGFTDHLRVSGSHGAVTYTQSAGAPALRVSSSGSVSAPNSLPAGTYKAAGNTRDTYGDSGSWSFALTVKARRLAQSAPTTGTAATGKAFNAQIKVSDSLGIVTYSQSTGAPQLKISSAGSLSAPANLSAGIYKAAGSARDRLGDTGSWSFTLTVTATKLTQTKPTKAKTGAGNAFTDRLAVSGSKGPVTYTESKGAPHLKVSSSGRITAPDTLRAGTYKATGTARDSLGDTGTWSFSLIVKRTKLKQGAPTTGIVTAGKVFTTQLEFAGSHGKLTYVQSSGNQPLTVSSSGKVTAPNSLAAGTYEVFGTVKDNVGDTGTWTFTLTVEGF